MIFPNGHLCRGGFHQVIVMQHINNHITNGECCLEWPAVIQTQDILQTLMPQHIAHRSRKRAMPPPPTPLSTINAICQERVFREGTQLLQYD